MAGFLETVLMGRGQYNRERDITRQSSMLSELLGTAPQLDPTANQYPQGDMMGPQALPSGAMTQGSGLLADPTDPRRLAAYAGGMMAELPAVGGSIINQMQGNQAQLQAQGMAGQQAMDRQRVQGEQNLAQQAQADAAAKVRQDGINAINLANQQAANAASGEKAAYAMMTAQEPWKVDLNAPKPAFNPYTGQNQTVAVAGTPEYAKAQQGMDPLNGITQDMYELVNLVTEYGSEAGGANAGRMASLYTSLLPRINQARGAGVPQAAELELLMQGLPNPNDWLTNAAGVIPGQRSKMIAGYNEAYRMVSQSALDWASTYPQVQANLGYLDPKVLSPEKRKFIESNQVSSEPWAYEQARKGYEARQAQARQAASAQASVGVLRNQ